MHMRQDIIVWGGWPRAAAILALGFGLALITGQASAQVDCSASPSATADFDQDGFTDLQECQGITLLDGSLFPGLASLEPVRRLDPNKKDLFVTYLPLSSGGHLRGVLDDPFKKQIFHGIEFNGLAALGLTVHYLVGAQIRADRIVSLSSPQKAVQIVESLNTSGDILGICQWGTPLGEDGCTVYTQRAKNFINATCPGDPRNQDVFLAYATYLVLHEAGHSLGGLSAEHNDRFGGYHYKPGAGIIMEQAAAYSTKGGKCTWFISNGWNMTLDPPAVKLK